MSAGLRAALNAAAEDVPAYPVHDRAVATARRTRRRAVVSAAAVAELAVLFAVGVPPSLSTEPAADRPGSLPALITEPPWGALHLDDPFARGPAAVAYSGWAAGGLTDEDSSVGFVGRDDDSYRVLPSTGDGIHAGESLRLSPDGARIVHPWWGNSEGEQGVETVDLTTGRTRRLPFAGTPLGWAPDSRHLLVTDGSTVTLADVTTGASRTVLDHPAASAAFAADGRLALYQSTNAGEGGGTVRVLDASGAQTAALPLPPEARLAGKGAWTADGRGLTLVVWGNATWSLRIVDPATGAALADPGLPAVPLAKAIELFGWTRTGEAVVGAWGSAGSMGYVAPHPVYEATQVHLVTLTPGAAEPVRLTTTPKGTSAIDVADQVISSGLTRPGSRPMPFGPRFFAWTAVVALLGAGAYWWHRRR